MVFFAANVILNVTWHEGQELQPQLPTHVSTSNIICVSLDLGFGPSL